MCVFHRYPFGAFLCGGCQLAAWQSNSALHTVFYVQPSVAVLLCGLEGMLLKHVTTYSFIYSFIFLSLFDLKGI